MIEPPKDPWSYTLATYFWVLFLSAWGGVVHFISKMRAGVARPFNFTELIGEMCISGFVGLVTFYLAQSSDVSPLVTAALVAISGHMGTRAIGLLEFIAMKKFPLAAEMLIRRESDGQSETQK